MSTLHLSEAMTIYSAGRPKDAIKRLSAAPELAGLAHDRRKAAAWMTLADGFMQGGTYDDAVECASQAVKLRPDSAQARLLLGRALACSFRLDDAIVQTRAAVALVPTDFEAARQLIVTLLESGLTHEALVESDAFVDRSGGNPEAAALHGQVLRRLGRSAEAERTLSAVLEQCPDLLQARLWLAHAVHDLGDNDRAARIYAEVTARNSAVEEAHYGLVNTLADQGRVAEAAEAYTRAHRTIPGFNARWPDFIFPVDLLATPELRAPTAEPGGLGMILGFVPFDRPMVPLPPAALKAYVERHSPHRVATVDLNARFFQGLRRAVAEKRTPFQLQDDDAFLRAADFLSTDSPSFFQPESYDQAASTLFQTISALKTVFIDQSRRSEQIFGPIPWHARALARAMVAAKPAVIGLSVMFDSQVFPAFAIARAVRSLNPDIRIVFGGTAFAREGIERVIGAHWVDYVVLRDGEEVLTALLDALAAGDRERRIPGLCYRRADGSPCIDENTQPVRQQKIPPADFDDYDLGAYFNPRPVLPVLTSRGCYWRRCTFCNAFTTYAGIYTAQTVTHVAEEMEAHGRRYGARHFYLVDKIVSAARYRKIGEAILARNLDVTYFGLAKPSDEFTPEAAEIAYRSGLRCLHWGQESGNDRILSAIDKGATAASSSAAYRATAGAGIRNHLFMIIGFPTEGLDELGDSVKFIIDNREVIDQVQAGPFVLEKGTPLYNNPEKYGITRIIERHCVGRIQLVKFKAARGFDERQTQAVEQRLRAALLRDISPISRLTAIFWDHALIHYSEHPRNWRDRPPLPPFEAVMTELREALSAVDNKAA